MLHTLKIFSILGAFILWTILELDQLNQKILLVLKYFGFGKASVVFKSKGSSTTVTCH